MKVTKNDIISMNTLYLKYKTYAEVARQTGFSASTVKKYIIPNYTPPIEIGKTFYFIDLPEFDTTIFQNKDDWNKICVLSEEEYEDVQELWKELEI